MHPKKRKAVSKTDYHLLLILRYYRHNFILISLNMEISFYQNTWRHIPEDGNRHSHSGDNLRSYFNKT